MNIVIQTGDHVIVNGKRIEIPDHIKRKGISQTTVNGTVFINGYQLMKDDTWKRTLRALWHLI